jgi:hypothetical protein
MLAGEVIGGRPLADVRSATWPGPWGWGVRPGQGARVAAREGAMRPDGDEGSKIR